jgi:hypothetical protein
VRGGAQSEDLDENGDTTLSDYGVYTVKDGELVFDETVTAAGDGSERAGGIDPGEGTVGTLAQNEAARADVMFPPAS